MTDDPPADASVWFRNLAERRGFTRALALTPARFWPALERAGQPLPPVPPGAATEPAAAFAPDAYRDET